MTADEKPIPPPDWQTIVENVPLVSVDLVIQHDGGVILAKRENEPAKGEWFVPGGTVMKNESRIEAVRRVAQEELKTSVVINDCFGTYEHFYETSEIDDIGSKHYIATAYCCHFEQDEPSLSTDSQHNAVDIFYPPFGDHHPYVERYLDKI